MLTYFSEYGYRVAQNIGTICVVRTPYLYQILTDFQNYFTVRIRRKYVITLSLQIPPHPKCVATLPCQMLQHFIDRTIGQWRRRLECVVQQHGGHIEHLM